MPRLSVYFIRASLIYGLFGFTFGGLLLANKGLVISPAIWMLLPIHIEFDLMGWLVQLAMGVAFWILPRFSREPRYGNQTFGWLAFVLLNAGVLCAGLGQWLGADPFVALVGRLAEVGAVIFFVGHAWPRVRPIGL